MKVRRVVTGHDRDGKAVFASDLEVDGLTAELMPGFEFHRLWAGDRVPDFPDDGSAPDAPQFFAPPGGFRFAVVTVPPDALRGPAPADPARAAAELEAKLPGLVGHLEPDSPGMHTSASIDFTYLLEGELWLELDDGATAHLRPGDVVVQNGTRHAWRNRGSAPARYVAFLLGAVHAEL